MTHSQNLRYLFICVTAVMIYNAAHALFGQTTPSGRQQKMLVDLLPPVHDPDNQPALPPAHLPSRSNYRSYRYTQPAVEKPMLTNAEYQAGYEAGFQAALQAALQQNPQAGLPAAYTPLDTRSATQQAVAEQPGLPPPSSIYGHRMSPDTIEPPDCIGCSTEPWDWQLLPDGLIYKNYIAGAKEGRFSTAWLYDSDGRWVWDSTLGARIGVVRFGTTSASNPEGWQLDMEGGAFTRLDIEEESDLEAADFVFSVPLTYSQGPWDFQFGYYHLSSHVGDEFLERNPGFVRNNFLRNAIILGVTYHLNQDWAVYGEASWSYETSGFADPWEFQFGADYAPAIANGIHGTPFFGINGRLREELNYGGGVNVLTGWQWRGRESDKTFRVGFQYYNGASLQNSFTFEHEELTGLGLWYDF